MLDINLIRENPQKIQQALLKRMAAVDFTELLRWDVERRNLIAESDDLKAGRNKVSSEIPRLKKQGKDTSGLIAEMKKVAGRIKNLDTARSELDRRIQGFLEVLPNIPADDVPSGGKENNKVIRVSDGKREFGFVPKDHMDLVGRLGLIDYERGVKLGGNGFWLYRGRGAVLEWALLNYFIEEHRSDG